MPILFIFSFSSVHEFHTHEFHVEVPIFFWIIFPKLVHGALKFPPRGIGVTLVPPQLRSSADRVLGDLAGTQQQRGLSGSDPRERVPAGETLVKKTRVFF